MILKCTCQIFRAPLAQEDVWETRTSSTQSSSSMEELDLPGGPQLLATRRARPRSGAEPSVPGKQRRVAGWADTVAFAILAGCSCGLRWRRRYDGAGFARCWWYRLQSDYDYHDYLLSVTRGAVAAACATAVILACSAGVHFWNH